MDLTTIIQVAIGMIFVWVILAVITSQIQEWVASVLAWRSSMLESTIKILMGEANPEDKVKNLAGLLGKIKRIFRKEPPTGLTKEIYDHPLIKGLYTNNGKRKPGGIPKDKFALVLLGEVMKASAKAADEVNTSSVSKDTGTVAESTTTVVKDANINNEQNKTTVEKTTITEVENTFKKLKNKVAELKSENKNPELAKFVDTLDTLLIGIEEKEKDANYTITEARQRVESWFDDSMERLGGAYRRRMQVVALVVGITIAAALNVDTGAIMTTLWRDPLIRQAVVAQAGQLQESQIQSGKTPPTADEIAESVEKLDALSLPIGWSSKTADKDPDTVDDPRDFPSSSGGWAAKIAGILLSGMAAAQGAPYWFDLMRKLLTRNPPVPQQPA